MAKKALKSKFFRIGVEGDTADGRLISRDDIEQMARNYDPKKYAARINCEHIRGLMPGGPFGAYGDVLELKNDTVEIDGEQKLALMASVSPTDELVALNKKRQKVFSSMEVRPNFGGSNEAYLVGMAITDSPASLGTEMMEFAAKAEHNPFAARKQHPDNLFTAAREIDLEFEDSTTLLDTVKSMFSKSDAKRTDQDDDFSAAITAVAEEVSNLQEQFKSLQPGTDHTAQLQTLSTDLKAAQDELSDLKALLEKTPNFKKRPPASGGDGQVLTDC